MTRLTKKTICLAAAKRHDLEPFMVELHRDRGVWYWAGVAASVFESSMISYMNLNDWPLERWLEDFDSHVEDWANDPFNKGEKLRDHLDSIEFKINESSKPEAIKIAYRKAPDTSLD